MFQRATRLVLFLVGATILLTSTRVFSLGPVIFSASRLSIILLLGWGVLIWANDRRRLHDRKLGWLVAFGIALLFSCVLAVGYGNPLVNTLLQSQQIFAPMVFSVLLAFSISDRQRLDALLVGYLLSFVLTSLSVLSGGSLMDISGEAGASGRTGGLGGDANHYALEALMGVLIAVLFFYTKRSVFWRIFLAAIVLLALAGIMKSLSRSALVAGALTFGLWMFRFRRVDMLKYLLPVGVLLGVSMMFVSTEWSDRMSTMMTAEGIEKDQSIGARFAGAEYGLRAFASNPVFGIGFRRIGPWAQEKSRLLRHSEAGSGTRTLGYKTVIHNVYLHVLGELGSAGAIPFGVFLVLTWKQYSAAWRLARGVRGDPELRTLYLYATFLQLAFFAMLVAGLFLPILHWKSFWLIIGLAAAVLELTIRRVGELQAGTELTEAPGFGDDDHFGVPSFGPRGPVQPGLRLR